MTLRALISAFILALVIVLVAIDAFGWRTWVFE